MAGKLGPKTPSMMLNGIVEPQTNPIQLVAKVHTFRNPLTGTTIRLHPVPLLAQKAYFDRLLHSAHAPPPPATATATSAASSSSSSSAPPPPRVDRVLMEDGKLPFVEGTPEGEGQLRRRRWFPFVAHRVVVPAASSGMFDGLLERNPLESRIAYDSVMSGERPLVDPRARRGVERADSYPPGTSIVMPWNVYHCLYIKEKLLASGYEQVAVEEEVIIGLQQVIYVALLLFVMSTYVTFMTLHLLGVF